jgi:hypothetical protein
MGNTKPQKWKFDYVSSFHQPLTTHWPQYFCQAKSVCIAQKRLSRDDVRMRGLLFLA